MDPLHHGPPPPPDQTENEGKGFSAAVRQQVTSCSKFRTWSLHLPTHKTTLPYYSYSSFCIAVPRLKSLLVINYDG